MDTFRNNLGESLPGFMLRITGIKEAKRGWAGRYIDGHSVSPNNACRKLGRTSPLHLKTGWGGNSIAQSKEHDLKKPDSLARSGADVPTMRENVNVVRVLMDTHRSDSFKIDPLSFGAYPWWTASEIE